jgi:glycosyltransferase involved in cell wall biosynthesis
MNGDQPIRLAVVIPAYKPSAALVDLVRTLSKTALPAVVIVDDGSGPEYREVFAQASALPRVELLRHAVNLGKGAALKTAFNHVLCAYPDIAGVVTADADGQHHPDDIRRVAETLMERPGALVLGSRQFEGDVPLRSRIGNVATRGIMHALLGQKLTDTQTGLRGIPAELLPRLLQIESRGYEFELEMLIAAHHLEIPVVEEPIRTIYEPGNKSSHFNPIVDSMKIYFVLLRFGSVSMITALLDNLIFYLAYRRTGHVLGAQVLARVFAVTFNYTMVRGSVFYSRQRHKAVLPKYLGLVVVSGTASYGGIRWLAASFGIGAVAAKLLVETFLFFVNFAVQRAFIFKPQESAGEQAQQPASISRFAIVVAVALAALVGVEIYGFATGHLFSQEIWLPVGAKRFTRYLGAYVFLAAPMLLIFPWSFTAAIAALLLVLTAFSVGVQPVVAVAFFLISSCALGTLLMGRRRVNSLCVTLLGTGVYVFLMLATARLPVNYMATWGAVLAIPIALDARGAWDRLREWAGALRRAELRSGGERAAFGLLIFLLIAQWFVALKPETGADGLAMHLAIPMNIAAHHRLTFEPARFLWAVMPMGADWAYSIVYLLGGEYAAHLLNFAMLAMVAGLIYQGARRWVTPGAAWLLAASFVATPVVQLVTGSLFVENFLAAMVLGVLTAVWLFGDTGDRRYLFLAVVMAGTAVTTKLGSIAFLLFILFFAAVEVKRQWRKLGRRPALTCALAVVLLLALSLPTYVIAWEKTGNAVFPFENQRFHSPLLNPMVNLSDVRYQIPLAWNTLYTLTFHSSLAYEGQDGSFGFQYLIVVPLALVGLFAAGRRRPAASAMIAALGAGCLIMRSQPNVRFLYAAMPLTLLAFAAVLGWAFERQRGLYRALIVCLFGCTALNAWFLPSSNYYHKDFCLKFPFSRAERDRYLEEAAPIRKIIEWQNQHHFGSGVLLTDDNEIAGLSGTIYENHWHQYPTVERLQRAFSVLEMFRLLESWKVRYLIAHKPDPSDPLRPESLRKLLAICTVPEYEMGDLYVAQLAPDCDENAPHTPAEPPLVVRPGFYDDIDPALLFRGDWSHDGTFRQPDRQTISYIDVSGAEVSIAFEGSALFYLYTMAPNRGIASIAVDGKEQGTIDLYAADVRWQQRSRFCCFGPGKHVAVVTVTGQHNPKSTGNFVDLDSFFVLP